MVNVNDIQTKIEGPFLRIPANEVIDVLKWEQLALVVCYAKNYQAVEKLLEYVKCDALKELA